jgi:uncharacterized protein (TIGR04141 family)
VSVPDDLKSMSLSVRLVREGRSVEESLRDEHGLREIEAEGGRLFIGQAPAVPPSWVTFIGQFTTRPRPALVNQSCAAVLFVPVKDEGPPAVQHMMAISFGTGHHALDPDAFERGFGLRVVLNSVARSRLRSVDIATLDATTFLKRVQASRDADLQGFGIDIDRDLLRLAAGSPKDPTFARSLAGKDALTLHTRTSATDVMEKCARALKLYRADDYKRDFGFIDFVMPVRDRGLREKLDALAFVELQTLVSGGASDLHVALPDVLDPEEGLEIGYYGLGPEIRSKASAYGTGDRGLCRGTEGRSHR